MVTTMADMSNFSNRMISKSASKSEAQVALNSQIEQLPHDACKSTTPLPSGVTPNIVPDNKGKKICVITFTYTDGSDSKNNFERTVLMPDLDQ